MSPTNVGLPLNARQVAIELGYLTVPEMTELTRKTLDTVARLSKYRGHLLNWYDTRTLAPKAPFFISSVDSGNLVASLWTLQQGCLEADEGRYFEGLAMACLDHRQDLRVGRAGGARKGCAVRGGDSRAGTIWMRWHLEFSQKMR